MSNNGLDNVDNNLIVYVQDIILSTKDKYGIIDLIGNMRYINTRSGYLRPSLQMSEGE